MKSIEYDKKAVGVEVIKKDYGKLCERYMSEFGQYVNEERAVPFIPDGLKPVQRRSLFVMHKTGAHPSKPTKKVVTLIGETLKYHPHGDKAIGDVIVTFAHTRYQLLDPQGAFGSPVAGAAAHRYIEGRLSKFGMRLFDRINISPMVDNFDGLEKEPEYVSTHIPLAVLNGYSGIGVGLASGMPSHNIRQVVKGLIYLLTDEKAKESTFLHHIDRPDFGSCIITSSKEDVNMVYRNGRGSISFLPKYSFQKDGDNVLLILDGVPPNLNIMNVIAKVKNNFQSEGLVDYIEEEVIDEKTINGIRPRVRLTVRAQNKKILSDDILPMFSSRFNTSMFIVDKKKDTKIVPAMSFFEFNVRWVEYQKIFKKQELTALLEKADYDLRMSEARHKIISSKSNIDKLIALLRKPMKSNEEYVKAISKTFKLDMEQAESLYNIQVRSLSNINVKALEAKIADLKKLIKELKEKLKNISACIVEDLKLLEKEFGDENETVYASEFKVAGSAIKGKTMIVGISESGKIYNDKYPSNVEYLKEVDDEVIVIGQDGLIREFDLSDLTGSTGFKVAGMVTTKSEYALITDNNGKCIVLDMEDSLESKKKAFSDIEEVTQAIGINIGDTVIVAKSKFEPQFVEVDEAFINKFKRKVGSKGNYIMSGHKRGVEVYYLPKDSTIVVNEEVSSKTKLAKLLEKDAEQDVSYLLDKNNLVLKSGKAELMSYDEAVKLLGKAIINE